MLRIRSLLSLPMSNVRFGSWLCKNAKLLDLDRRSYSLETVLSLQIAFAFNLTVKAKNVYSRRVSIFCVFTQLGPTADVNRPAVVQVSFAHYLRVPSSMI